MSPDQVQQIIDAVKNASPALWAAAQHQVHANILADQFWVVALCVLLILFVMIAALSVNRAIAADGRRGGDDAAFFWGLAAVISVVLGIVALIMLVVVINNLIYLYNAPDYAAIQQLTNLVPSH